MREPAPHGSAVGVTPAPRTSASSAHAATPPAAGGDDADPSALRATQVATGVGLSCARLTDGQVACWGSGWLGDGARHLRSRPVLVKGLTQVEDIAVGDFDACARLKEGTVRCWGAHANAWRGPHRYEPTADPTRLVDGLPSPARALAVGLAHACAIVDAGRVLCWGDPALGNGLRDTAPQDMGVGGAVSLAAYSARTCAVDADGEVSCWGNAFGASQPPGMRLERSAIPELRGARQVAVGGGGGCVITSEGRVACWAVHLTGRTDPPSPLAGLPDVRRLAAGGEQACAIFGAGSVRCWPLGDALGPGAPTAIPVQEAKDVSVGLRHACAVASEGRVACWGESTEGAIGDGTAAPHRAPYVVRW